MMSSISDGASYGYVDVGDQWVKVSNFGEVERIDKVKLPDGKNLAAYSIYKGILLRDIDGAPEDGSVGIMYLPGGKISLISEDDIICEDAVMGEDVDFVYPISCEDEGISYKIPDDIEQAIKDVAYSLENAQDDGYGPGINVRTKVDYLAEKIEESKVDVDLDCAKQLVIHNNGAIFDDGTIIIYNDDNENRNKKEVPSMIRKRELQGTVINVDTLPALIAAAMKAHYTLIDTDASIGERIDASDDITDILYEMGLI